MKTKDSIVELEERQCKTNVPASDKLGEECGVFGVYDFDGGDVASTIYYGLFALQHRGQESCGMLISAVHKEKGEEALHLLMVDDAIPAGAKLC